MRGPFRNDQRRRRRQFSDPRDSQEAGLRAAETAVAAIAHDLGSYHAVSGGVVRSGSKVGSRYKKLRASTNDAYCPTLRGRGTNCPTVAMRFTRSSSTGSICPPSKKRPASAFAPACGPGVLAISAGNYGGKLGPFLLYLRKLLLILMDDPADERSLIRKLVATCHLNVAEQATSERRRETRVSFSMQSKMSFGTRGWYPAVAPTTTLLERLSSECPTIAAESTGNRRFHFCDTGLDVVGEFATCARSGAGLPCERFFQNRSTASA